MVATAWFERRTQTEASDADLIARCRDGDTEAFGQIFARHEQAVFRYALYLLGQQDDASDVKQETFLRAFQSVSGFRGGASLRTWLLKICVNLCRDRLRARKVQPVPLDAVTEERLGAAMPTDDPHEQAERADTIQTIRRVLLALPAAHREILVLHEIENLDYPEIARVLGCATPTARMRLFRARAILRERVVSLMNEREITGRQMP